MFASKIYYVDTYLQNKTAFARSFSTHAEYSKWIKAEYDRVKGERPVKINALWQQVNQAVFARVSLDMKVVAIGPQANAVSEFINQLGHGHIVDVIGE